MDDRNAARSAVHAAQARLPGWTVTRAEYQGEEGRWHVTAVDATNRGRRAMHEAIEASGATELEALETLARRIGDR